MPTSKTRQFAAATFAVIAGEMVDYDLSDEAVAAAMAEVPVIAG